MNTHPSPHTYTLGVEEEYQLVNPETRELWGRAGKVIATAEKHYKDLIQPEMHRCQVEIATNVCHALADVQQELIEARQEVIEAAKVHKAAVVAAGTHPFSRWQSQRVTNKPRYRQLERDLQQVIKDLIIFGCHVHVGINETELEEDRDLAIALVNRCRLWLSPLLALTANSPFWEGHDTGYDSFRIEMWSRLPTAGTPPVFADYAEYKAFTDTLTSAGIISDPTKLYWDIRLSHRFPTIEFRVADVCMTVDETVMLAGLVRALVRTSHEAILRGESFTPVRSELIKAAQWSTARYGLTADLVNLQTNQVLPAQEYIEQLLEMLRPALEAEGDWDRVSHQVYRILDQGNGASRQRERFISTGSLEAVVDMLIEQTAAGVTQPSYASR